VGPVKIAVVIPALCEAESIQSAVHSARAPEVEVLVVDGGSRDATRERARDAGARVLESAAGRARQLAAGVRGTDADVLLFLHADTRLPPGWAPAVRAALADPAVAGGAFAFRFGPAPGASAWARLVLRAVERGVATRVALLALPYGDQALFARREALERAGGVRETPIFEDLDLVAAIRRSGRLAALPLPVATSPRRYLEGGALRTFARHALALGAYYLGLDRARLAAWVGR
jgi:rSAM/selenodomain-associated transferase 2